MIKTFSNVRVEILAEGRASFDWNTVWSDAISRTGGFDLVFTEEDGVKTLKIDARDNSKATSSET